MIEKIANPKPILCLLEDVSFHTKIPMRVPNTMSETLIMEKTNAPERSFNASNRKYVEYRFTIPTIVPILISFKEKLKFFFNISNRIPMINAAPKMIVKN